MKMEFDGYWDRLFSDSEPNYVITGKYLFFSEDREKLIKIAINEIKNHDFHRAKVNRELLEGQKEYVLCVYYKDDSRKSELAERNRQEYGVKYRYWKSDIATLTGQYSKEFLDKLDESKRKRFTRDKSHISSE
jgi:hypothetical protein